MDRCLRAGTLAIGGQVEIVTLPGYMPLINNEHLMEMFSQNAADLVGDENVRQNPSHVNRGGSTDMGDLSQVMPVIHPYTGAATGSGHGVYYVIKDYTQAVINPAKAMAATVIDLLAGDSTQAHNVINNFKPNLSIDSYVSMQRSRLTEETYRVT